jgi:hypothetical protein
LLVAGCGSQSPADLPAPAGPPASPPLRVAPAGESGNQPIAPSKSSLRVDRRRDRLIDGQRSVATCREPVDVAILSRGARLAVLCARAREVDVYDAKTLQRLGRVPAGIGPTHLASDNVDVFYVIDALGESLLVFHQAPLELIRRVHLGGGPYAIAFDRERWGLWITLNGANQLVNYAAGIRPVLRKAYPSIQNARRVTVDEHSVRVLGATDAQVLRLRSR